MTVLKLTLLGGFEARLSAGSILDLPTKGQGLLAYLGVRPGQRHSRDKLAALFWGDKSDEHARGGLRRTLVDVRRALATAQARVLQTEGGSLALDPEEVEVDTVRFEHRVAEGTLGALEEAAAMYRGDLLHGFSLNEPSFEEWLVVERERLREMAAEALARLLAQQTDSRSTERAIQTALRLLALDPLQEAVHRTLMRLYARQGRRGAALKQYQACVAVLRRELGTEPEPETRRLSQDLLWRLPNQAESATTQVDAGQRAGGGIAAADVAAAETRLFGRERELARLRELLDDALARRGHVVTLSGEAGIGKTRLISALAADALSRGCRVLIGRCHESDSILPFGPWVDACHSGELSTDQEILGALHPARRAELTRLLPEAGKAGLPRASNGPLLLFESMAELIEQMASRRPLLLVLEDVHWADEMSLRLLAFIARRIPAWAALLVATARREELADASMAHRTLEELGRAPRACAVLLSPLGRAETAMLVRALTNIGIGERTLRLLEERIWAVSEGNPFVAIEAIRSVGDERLRADAWAEDDELALPPRVRDLVAARLDRLSPKSQELAAVAAVIGRRFDFTLLRCAGAMGEREAAEAVEEMVCQYVLQAVGGQLDFTHDRVRDVTYARLLPARRVLLHRAVAEALEAAGVEIAYATEPKSRDLSGEQIEQIAHHAFLGDMREKAVGYLLQAGEMAAARSALADARTWFTRALDVLVALPATPSTLEQAFDLRLRLSTILTMLDRFESLPELLQEAETLADRLNDDGRRCRVLARMANVHARLDHLDEALATGSRARQFACRLGDPQVRRAATSCLEEVHYCRGDYVRVVELAKANLTAMGDGRHDARLDSSSRLLSIIDRFWLVFSLIELGRFAEAAEHAADAVRVAEGAADPPTVSLAYLTSAILRVRRGDWARAGELIERAIAAFRSGNILDDLAGALAVSAMILAERGNLAEAAKRLDEARELFEHRESGGRSGRFMWAFAPMARALLVLGCPDEARRLAELALPSARIDFKAHALLLLGHVATESEQFDAETGEACFRKLLALAEPHGMRVFTAHAHLGLGQLYRRVDKPEEAVEHLVTAASMYRDMDLRLWLGRAEAFTG